MERHLMIRRHFLLGAAATALAAAGKNASAAPSTGPADGPQKIEAVELLELHGAYTEEGGVNAQPQVIPQGVVDGTDPHHEEAITRVTVGTIHLVPEGFTGKRVFTKDKRAKLLLDNDGCAFLNGTIQAFDAAGGFDTQIDRGGVHLLRPR